MEEAGPRQTIDLSGVWKYSCASEALLGEQPGEPWQESHVPSNWHVAGLPNYAGNVWFLTTFSLPQLAADQVAHLRFHGVDYFAEVWLNGRFVGYHEGYFQTFVFDVTELVQEENTLLVEVISPNEDADTWPHRKRLIKGILNMSDCRPGAWHPQMGQDGNTGGIWNTVDVVIGHATHVHQLQVTPVLLSRQVARLQVNAVVVSPATEEIRALLRIYHIGESGRTLVVDEERVLRLNTGPNAQIFIETIEQPQLWWTWDRGPQNFYVVELELRRDGDLLDRMEVRSGIREFKIDTDGVWYLNRQRIFPRGTNFIPALWLSEYTKERIDQDIKLLKEANVNAVRIHAHVNRAELYDALDEAGIAVWQDFALQWVYDDDDKFADTAITQIQDMVRLLYNHPSIIIWACQNEPHRNLQTLDPMLASAVLQLDASRIVWKASTGEDHTYPGWYYGSYLEYRETPAEPLVTEFGAQALPSLDLLREMFPDGKLFPPDWEDWAYHCFAFHEMFHVAKVEMGPDIETFMRNSQEYQARLLQFAVESYRRIKYQPITGLFQFMFVDCWPSITWSVVDAHREPKLGYYILKRAYQPLLGSLDIREDIVSQGQWVNIGLSIINDLMDHLSSLTWILRVLDPDGVTLEQWSGITNVESDSVVVMGDPVRPHRTWKVPVDAREGAYTVEVQLSSYTGDILSTNSVSFTVHDSRGWIREY